MKFFVITSLFSYTVAQFCWPGTNNNGFTANTDIKTPNDGRTTIRYCLTQPATYDSVRISNYVEYILENLNRYSALELSYGSNCDVSITFASISDRNVLAYYNPRSNKIVVDYNKIKSLKMLLKVTNNKKKYIHISLIEIF